MSAPGLFEEQWDFESDPFGPDDPSTGVKTRSAVQLTGKEDRKKHPNYETKTKEWFQKLGYHYHKCEQFHQGWVGGAFAGGVKRDVFGIVDAIAIGKGKLILVQTTSKACVNEHVRKIVKGTYKLGSTASYPIRPVVDSILECPGVELVIVGWYQEGRFWKPEVTKVTTELIEKITSRMRVAK